MLEVKHLKRIYHVKNAEPVYALNDISLKFPETGLVFILGKSGSGKSTLLNVMGGLDVADEGEIIIDGKSSKDFSKGEMDSYRNTYLGFIFQEYNILSDFNVRENIALALQLQHKKATDEEVEKILQEVDLAGYGKRKPNELSGGQKQRVAIARALVKEPKIIFADEPTGALDSNTGKQVFDTLKKLSKDKLVVVVSHDRDFAERYGDRIIELKDGKVISDVSKTFAPSKTSKDGISLLGDNILHLNGNRPLTVDDLPLLNETIAKGNGDVFIVADSHINESIRENAKIDKNGNREEFISTDQNKNRGGQGVFQAIKSKFSLGRAIKMGARSLKIKPFRLAMTILLSTFSFTLFGLSLTASLFSTKNALSSTLQKDGMHYSTLIMNEYGKNHGYTEDRIKEIEENSGSKLYLSYSDYVASGFNKPSNHPGDYFHLSSYTGTITIQNSFLDDFGFSLIQGEMPKDDSECLISQYAFYTYQDYGFGDKTWLDFIPAKQVTMDAIIGKKLPVISSSEHQTDFSELTITGIVDTKFPENLLKYRDVTNVESSDKNYSELNSLQHGPSIHSSLFVGKAKDTDRSISFSMENFTVSTDNGRFEMSNLGYYKNHKNVIYFDKTHGESLSKGETLLSLGALASSFDGYSAKRYDFIFPNAYLSQEKNDANLYQVSGRKRFELEEDAKTAAVYKTKCDKYEDFFQDHLDMVKKINEGNYEYSLRVIDPIQDEKGNDYFDYNDATSSQKYQLFSRYVDYFISPISAGKNADKTSEYYAYYSSSLKDYRNLLNQKFPLSTEEVIYNFGIIHMNVINDYLDERYQDIYEKYKDNSSFQNTTEKYVGEITDEASKRKAVETFLEFSENSIDEGKEVKSLFFEYYKGLINEISPKPFDITVSFKTKGNENDGRAALPLKVVGIDMEEIDGAIDMFVSKEDAQYVKENLYSTYGEMASNYSYITFGNDSKAMDSFLGYFLKKAEDNNSSSMKEGDWYLSFWDRSLSNVEFVGNMLSMFSSIFLYVGIGLALFSMLLFYNFISVSINNKKREIGILRAVGAKRADVFKIFYSEACIIAFFNFVLSTIGTFGFSFLMNVELGKNTFITFNVMNPNILVVLALLGVALLAAFISAFLPVTKLANKKPIDAIQNR